jgi:23S rRNA (uracil1939-C5)-methyltransferase
MLPRERPARSAETADIVDLAHDGRGVTHSAGKAVFIDDALPGETVEWIRTKRSRNFDEGRLERVILPSPDRVDPRCAHFGVCGGCALQHLAPQKQIEFKQRQLLEALVRIGQVTPAAMLPPLQAPVWGYRRRARLAARWVPKKERVVVGFRERSTPYVADLRGCEVVQEQAARLIEPLSAMLTRTSIRQRVPQIEVAVADNAMALVIRVLDAPSASDMESFRQFGREHSLQIYLQPGGYDSVAPIEADVLPLEYTLAAFDVRLRFLPTDFIQVNGALNSLMVERALELLAPAASESVLDLFCGLGNFSLPLARRAGRVLGVEGEAGLVQRARDNAALNALSNVEFVTANLADASLGDAPWAMCRYDKVLLDPPRAGAREVLPVVHRCGASRVVYVSCHPGTLARDAGILVREHGFNLVSAGVMDMFPHTAHVESIAVFERGGSRP